MPYCTIDSLKIYYEEYIPEHRSNKCPIIFLHGFTLDHRMWKPQAEYFKSNYHVIIPDTRGHGLSEVPETGYSRNRRVEDLIELINQLGIKKIHLVGLSQGGSTAIGFALEYQKMLKSLTLVDTGADGFSAGPKISKIDKIAQTKGIEAARDRWIKTALMWYNDTQHDIKESVEKMMLEHSGAIWVDPMRGKYKTANDLENVHKIEIPTKIFVGEMDKIFLPLAQQIHKRIEKSLLSIYQNVGHMLNLEAPTRFNEELEKFIVSVD
ncbi:MAG: alpha/beta hydrolase [candidate division Zixibacteria bacterium]|nr:alpha/beta hydrolase [candidate division Zixibacteria bacterium]